MSKRKYIICIAVALAVLLGASFIVGQRSAEKAVETSSAESKAYAEPITETLPIKVVTDTDGERAYGGDILYCHDGLTVQLLESDFSDGKSNIRLKFKNDSDKSMVFSTDDVVVNTVVTSASTLAIVEPGAEEERMLFSLAEYLPSESTVDDVMIKFLIYDEDYTESVTSEPISIVYNEAEHNYTRPDAAWLIWEARGVQIYAYSVEKVYEDVLDDHVKLRLCIENNSDEEYIISTAYNSEYYELDGEQQPLSSYFYKKMPGGTIGTDTAEFYLDDCQRLGDVDKINFKISLYSSDDMWSDREESDNITIDVE